MNKLHSSEGHVVLDSRGNIVAISIDDLELREINYHVCDYFYSKCEVIVLGFPIGLVPNSPGLKEMLRAKFIASNPLRIIFNKGITLRAFFLYIYDYNESSTHECERVQVTITSMSISEDQ